MKIKEKVANTNMEPQLKELLQRIVLHSNIPRKEVKFRVRHVEYFILPKCCIHLDIDVVPFMGTLIM